MEGSQKMDAKRLGHFRKLLLDEKQRVYNQTRNSFKDELQISQDDLPDETDLAVSEVNQSLVFKLKDRERMMLQKIDEALARLDEGSFGVCADCEENIEPKRLEVSPMSTHCISCKEQAEHKQKIYA